jgi:DNA-directed RNA polymerase specialized sigma24 family protein
MRLSKRGHNISEDIGFKVPGIDYVIEHYLTDATDVAKTVLRLRYSEGKTHKEIGYILGISLQTVRTHHYRSLLRARLSIKEMQ